MSILKKTVTLAALIGLTTLSQAALYNIDPGHANARFYIDHFGTSTNSGAFTGLTGIVDYTPEQKKGFVGITIPISSLSVGFKPFEKHLKSADFFDVEKYPTAYFKSTNWQFNGDKVAAVTGDLTMVGETHPVTLVAKQFNCYDSPILNKQVCGGDFEATIDRTLWGIDTYALPNQPNNVKLVIQIEAALAE